MNIKKTVLSIMVGLAVFGIIANQKMNETINEKVYEKIIEANITIEKDNVNCSGLGKISCDLSNVSSNKFVNGVKISIEKVSINNMESLDGIIKAIENYDNEQTVTVNEEIEIKMTGLKVEKSGTSLSNQNFQTLKIKELEAETKLDIKADKIESGFLSINFEGVTTSVNDGKDSPVVNVNIEINKNKSSYKINSETVEINLEGNQKITTIQEISNMAEEILKSDTTKFNLVIKPDFKTLQNNILEGFKTVSSPEEIKNMEAKLISINEGIKDKKQARRRLKNSMPQLINLANSINLELKNPDKVVDSLLAYLTGVSSTLSIGIQNKVIEIN